MKNLVIRIVAMLVAFLLSVVGYAQTSIGGTGTTGKLSVTTQMFLDELSAPASDNTTLANEKRLGLKRTKPQPTRPGKNFGRIYAAPDTINGVAYISAFIRLSDNSDLSDLEALGVKVQCKFQKGLVTTLIPVDKIQQVSQIANVRRVNVATLKSAYTDNAREKTNVDDILIHSTDAITAGLPKKYDGKGVVMGVIDTGIDFQHIAFKDKDGNSRIKGAYIYDGSTATEYTSSNIGSATTDDTSGDHGTHTCSTAGGSSVIINGSSVTVTDDHSAATYGGMAPGSDLFLCGVNSLSDTYLANSFQKIIEYAGDRPVVVSNSWGSHFGPHDGTGDYADICNQYFGGSNTNRICLFASSNDAGKPIDGEGGGYHLKGTATSSNPVGSILRSHTYSNTDAGYFYQGIIANAWSRSTSLDGMAVKIYVLDSSTGEVKTSVTKTSYGTVTGLSTYYSGTLYVYFDQVEGTDKKQVLLYSQNGLTSRSTSTTTKNGSTYYTSKYTLAVEFYPTSGSSVIDAWGGSYGYFTNYLTSSGHNWTNGDDDMSASDEATIADAISVGAYVSKNSITDYTGTENDFSDTYTMGDIAYFSSYATADGNPIGQKLPWITAPGARLVAGVNHLHTNSVDEYNYIDGDYTADRVNTNTTYPYAAMEGTSMATPTAAGIVALWLQAASETGQTFTTSQIKELMKNTAINDAYTTTGANASHFGQGKIDALAGIEEILSAVSGPTIIASPSTLSFNCSPGEVKQNTLNVSGWNLTGNISISLTDANGVFSLSSASVTTTEAPEGKDITVSFSPTAEGTYTATLTLASAGAETVTVTLTATAQDIGAASDPFLKVTKYSTIDEAGWNTTYVNTLYKYTEYKTDKVAWLTLPLYGAWSSVYYDSHPQKWIETSLGNNNTYGGTSWSASDKCLGSSTYFTSATARAMGYNSRTNTSVRTVSFYVGKTSAVQLYGTGRSGASSSSYPASLKVYECTVDDSGNVTASSTATKSETSSSTSTFTLSADGLDTEKVYKVEASIYRGYLYEIGFQMPLDNPTITASASSLSMSTIKGVSTTATVTVGGSDLEGDITATLTDANNVFSIDSNTVTTTEAATGKDITVAFLPAATGTFNATLTLSSSNAANVTVSISGTATQPELIADPETLTFSTPYDTPQALTFDVLGTDLAGEVTATLTDPDNVFTLSANSISAADAENGETLTVTFTPSAIGNYTGSITLSSDYAADVTVTLSATATKVYPDYFDVTVSKYGVTTLYLDFPVEIPYDTYDPDLLGVYYAYGVTDGEVRLARLNSAIPANCGVVVQGNAGTFRFPKASTTPAALPRTNLLRGTVEPTTVDQALAEAGVTDGVVLTMGMGSNGYIGFYKYSGQSLAANKAFFVHDNSLGNVISSLSITFDDETTGIGGIEKDDNGKAVWYTLQGIRLNGKPAQKGVYIVNGKRIAVK